MDRGPLIRRVLEVCTIGEHAVEGRQSGLLQTCKVRRNFHIILVHTYSLTVCSVPSRANSYTTHIWYVLTTNLWIKLTSRY